LQSTKGTLLCTLFILQEATVDELAAIKRLQLHTNACGAGWTALHYAVATQKVKLVQQLLELGASPTQTAWIRDTGFGTGWMSPLHLACARPAKNAKQLYQLMASAAADVHDVQVSCTTGPAPCSANAVCCHVGLNALCPNASSAP
jgi:hypothetical protein